MTINPFFKKHGLIKTGIAATILIILAAMPFLAEYERPLKESKLPASAGSFIKSAFPEERISFAKIEIEALRTEYEVFLSNGTKLVFNGKGKWKEIDCKHSSVPAGIIPEQIMDFIIKHGLDPSVQKISIGRKKTEAELSDGTELEFDRRFNLIGFDD